MPINDDTLVAIAAENDELKALVKELHAQIAKDEEAWKRIFATESPSVDPELAKVWKAVEALRHWHKESEQQIERLEAAIKHHADAMQGIMPLPGQEKL